MLSFKQFLSENKLRSGLEHLKNLKHEQLGSLLSGNLLKGVSTRKTDGAAGEVGWDENGFYTRSARSDKVRNRGDYSAYTRNKRGEDADTSVSSQYDEMHHHLHSNPNLTSYLRSRHEQGKPSSIKGEFFLRGLGEKTKKGIKFVGTSYNPNAMGSHGMFIMHHKLDGNETHDPEEVSKLGNDKVTFDHDKSDNNEFSVDVSKERELHKSINPDILKSRKSADAEAKATETEKLNQVKNSLEQKLKDHAAQVQARPWEVEGESEGDVFHTPHGRFKIQSDAFKQFKTDQKGTKKNA